MLGGRTSQRDGGEVSLLLPLFVPRIQKGKELLSSVMPS